MLFSNRAHTLRAMAAVGMALGASAAVIPDRLIGVCASEEMSCAMVMKPTLLRVGEVATATNVVALVYLRGMGPDLLEYPPQERRAAHMEKGYQGKGLILAGMG